MSSTNPPERASRPSHLRVCPADLDPETTPAVDVYPDFIQHNELLCPRCFRQRRDVELVTEATGEAHGDVLAVRTRAYHDGREERTEYWTTQRVPEWTIRDTPVPRTGEGPNPPAVAICSCGQVDPSGYGETRSKGELVTHAATISALLERWSVPHDWVWLLGMVRRLKGRPRFAGNDDLVLELGVASSVRRGRGRDWRTVVRPVLDRHS